MKSTIYLLAAFLLAGCAEKEPAQTSDRPVVFVSIIPQSGIAKAIAGDRLQIRTLVGEGQSPHAYEPTARQLVRLGQASALLTIGVPFEQHLLRKIEPLYPDLPVIETQDGIALRIMPHAHHGEACSHDHGEKDPHVWLSPTNLITIARTICTAFEELDPPGAVIYRENLETLTLELKQLDSAIHTRLNSFSGGRIYVFHPSFGYFCDTYSLQQIPVELDGKSPSPRQLVALIDQAKADGVKVIFVQKQFPADSANAMADAIEGSVVPLDPLAEDSIANLRLIADSIAEALEP
jgi:zinc transport system substrate-binding protein